jgi:hypothetical protein
MNYFDRFLSRTALLRSKNEAQLLALTCFYLSVKVFQAGPILSTHQISAISGFVFSANQVTAMEKRILVTLDWCLYPPCAADFLKPYFAVLMRHMSLPPDLCCSEVLDRALAMLNAATLLDYFFVAYQLPPSHIATAALLNASRSILPLTSSIPTVQDATKVLAQFSSSSMNEARIQLCCHRLWDIDETGINRFWRPQRVTDFSSGYIPSSRLGDKSTPSSPVGVVSATVSHQIPCTIFAPLSTR